MANQNSYKGNMELCSSWVLLLLLRNAAHLSSERQARSTLPGAQAVRAWRSGIWSVTVSKAVFLFGGPLFFVFFPKGESQAV